MDKLFEAADSGDVLAHPHITNTHIYTHTLKYVYKKNVFIKIFLFDFFNLKIVEKLNKSIY